MSARKNTILPLQKGEIHVKAEPPHFSIFLPCCVSWGLICLQYLKLLFNELCEIWQTHNLFELQSISCINEGKKKAKN